MTQVIVGIYAKREGLPGIYGLAVIGECSPGSILILADSLGIGVHINGFGKGVIEIELEASGVAAKVNNRPL